MNTKSVGYGPQAVLDEAVDQGELPFAIGAIGSSGGRFSHGHTPQVTETRTSITSLAQITLFKSPL